MTKDSPKRHRAAPKQDPASFKKRPIDVPIEIHNRIEALAIEDGISWNAKVNQLLKSHPLLSGQAA